MPYRLAKPAHLTIRNCALSGIYYNFYIQFTMRGVSQCKGAPRDCPAITMEEKENSRGVLAPYRREINYSSCLWIKGATRPEEYTHSLYQSIVFGASLYSTRRLRGCLCMGSLWRYRNVHLLLLLLLLLQLQKLPRREKLESTLCTKSAVLLKERGNEFITFLKRVSFNRLKAS